MVNAAMIGFLAGFNYISDYAVAMRMSLIIVGGFFLIKALMRSVNRVFRS